MFANVFSAGLMPGFRTPPPPPPSSSSARSGPTTVTTAEAAITARPGDNLRIEVLADEATSVPEGAPVARLSSHPEIVLVAPMPARVARIGLRPGRRLSEIVVFHDEAGDRLEHKISAAARAGDEAALRALMQAAGFWPRIRRRPFGGMPSPGERPAALVVMAVDTKPLALDPRAAITGREEDLDRGLAAFSGLTDGPVLLCQGAGTSVAGQGAAGRLRRVTPGAWHPHGLAGHSIHRHCPAGIDTPVWDVHVEDVTDLGALLRTGHLPQTRLVKVAGAALTETRILRCQAGADLRALVYGAVLPGPHVVLSGSPLDGHPSRWLGARDRQVSVLPAPSAAPQPHWFRAALTRWSLPRPVIPTAALTQSAGSTFPVMAMVRALAVGDDETAMKLGVLSLLEEDLALIDYVIGGDPALMTLLRTMLDRIETELAA